MCGKMRFAARVFRQYVRTFEERNGAQSAGDTTPRKGGVEGGVTPPKRGVQGGCKGGCYPPKEGGVCRLFAPLLPPICRQCTPCNSAPRAQAGDPKPTPTRAQATHQSRPHHPNGESLSAPKPHPNPTLYRAAIHPYPKTPQECPYKPHKSTAERPQPAPNHPPRADHPSPAQPPPCARYARAGVDPRKWHIPTQQHSLRPHAT